MSREFKAFNDAREATRYATDRVPAAADAATSYIIQHTLYILLRDGILIKNDKFSSDADSMDIS